jgi:hypothetical protein
MKESVTGGKERLVCPPGLSPTTRRRTLPVCRCTNPIPKAKESKPPFEVVTGGARHLGYSVTAREMGLTTEALKRRVLKNSGTPLAGALWRGLGDISQHWGTTPDLTRFLYPP